MGNANGSGRTTRMLQAAAAQAIATHRDSIVIAFTESDAWHLLHHFRAIESSLWSHLYPPNRILHYNGQDLPTVRFVTHYELNQFHPLNFETMTYKTVEPERVFFDHSTVRRLLKAAHRELYRWDNISVGVSNAAATEGASQ